jgi:beta-N-acetylhexosaminidase
VPPSLTRRQFIGGASATVGALALGCSLDRVQPTPSPRPTITPLPTPTPSPAPTPTPLSLRRRAAQMMVVGFRGHELADDDSVLRAIAEDGLGGVILFARNISSVDQLALLTARLRRAAGERTLLIAVDQEGGAVARLGPDDGFPAAPSAARVGRRADAAYALDVGRSTAATLVQAGINLNLAPVVDLNVNPDNPSIGALGRSYSVDPDVVVEMAGAVIAGHREQRVLTTLKHFPGLGSATGDTDREFVDTTATWTDTELEPFRRLIDGGLADLVMVGNALNGQLDLRHSASLSSATLRLLRHDLGWDGVVITDDLGAGALRDNYDPDEILRLAITAGSDLLLLANSASHPPDVVPGTLDAIVRLVEQGDLDVSLIDQAGARIARLLESA